MTENSKMLERVRALLAKADSTDFPEEAAAFRAKADALMTQYAIDQWMVDEAQAGTEARPKPEVRHMDFAWWYTSERHSELWDLFCDTAHHCRCVVATRGQGSSGSYRQMPVIGLPADLDYFDMLFTSLMLQMGKQLEPRPDADGELGEQVFLLRQAGQPWERITEQVFLAGLVTPTKKETEKVNEWRARYATGYLNPNAVGEPIEWRELKHSEAWTDMKNRLANANRKYVKTNGLQQERNYVKPRVYQRSFAIGFVDEVRRRFFAMRREQASGQTSGMELALVDIRQQALNLYEDMWPTPEEDPNKKKRRAVVKSVRVDHASIQAGRAAGSRADLQGHPGRRVGSQKGLPQG
jgi:hypothetical protein